jgi:hypothetical protein
MTDGPLYGKWPGEVASYDGPSRTCRVRIPGVTDGSNVLPVAEIEYPIGDRSDDANSKNHTEIRIQVGDPVWLEFECGDPRFPIITGARSKREGNPTNWRRWRHPNIEITADNELIINASNVTWNVSGNVQENIGGNQTVGVGGAMKTTAATSTHSAATHALTAQTTIAGALTTAAGPGGAGASIQGPVNIIGGTVTHDGTNIGKTHVHTEQGDGNDTSAPH